jgi:antitoxin component of MazEF toxin-antitoxin module
MRTKIIAIGNSRGIRIPKILLKEVGLEADVELVITKNGLKILPVKKVTETLLLSEKALAKDWNRPEEDEAWANL